MGCSNAVRLRSLAGVALLAAGLAPAAAPAQQADTLRDRWSLGYPQGVEIPTFTLAAEKARSAPGSSSGSQVAFGASWGTVYAGMGFQSRTRYAPSSFDRDAVDGAVSVGFGLGDAQKLVGLDVSIASLGTFDSFGRFSIGLKAHRMLPGNAAVAVGVENAHVIGFTDSDRSYFVVGSKQFNLKESASEPFSAVMASIGLGNGRYLPEEDFQAGAGGVNLFGSVGVRVLEPVGVIADWTGQDLALAVSLVPFRSIPLVITPGFADVTGSAGDGARFTVGAGMGFYLPSSFR